MATRSGIRLGTREARAPRSRGRVVERLEERSLLSAGAIDKSFGLQIPYASPPVDPLAPQRRGFITTDFGGTGDARFDMATSVALAPDGKIVVAGSSKLLQRMAVARYNYDGTPDTTFGAGTGRIEFAARPFMDDRDWHSRASGVAVQPDGSIIVAGITFLYDPTSGSGPSDVAVARLNSDGSPDLNFGALGTAIFSVGARNDEAAGVILQPDGKIVVAGTAGVDYGDNDAFVARLDTGGHLDTTFGSGGKTTLNLGFDDGLSALALAPGGKIVVTGWAGDPNHNKLDVLVARFTKSGQLDTSGRGGFGLSRPHSTTRDGFVRTSLSSSPYVDPDRGYGVAVQADGRIVVAASYGQRGRPGNSGSGLAVLRYTTQGTLDSNFGVQGMTLYAHADPADVALDASGRIVVAGNSQGDLFLVRLNANGSRDLSFEATPLPAALQTAPSTAEGEGVAIQPNGRIVVAGSVQSKTDAFATDWLLARYLDGRSLQASWGNRAGAEPAVFKRATAAWSVQWLVGEAPIAPILSPLGSTNLNINLPVAADFDGDGLVDQALYRPSGNEWEIHLRTGKTISTHFGAGTNGVPVAADFDGDGKADLAMFNAGTATWTIHQSADGAVVSRKIPRQAGKAALMPVPADFDGDGKADLATFNVSTSDWVILKSSSSQRISRRVSEIGPNLAWIPVPADYNGDGLAELAAFRPGTARWRGYDLAGKVLLFNSTFGGRRWLDIPLLASFGSLKQLGKI